MKSVKVLLLFIGLSLFLNEAVAQEAASKPKGPAPIPVELFFGNNRLFSTVSVNRMFTGSDRFGVIASSTIAFSYSNELSENESMNVLFLSYNLHKGFGLLAGFGLNSSWGFRPFAGGQYAYASKAFFAMVSSGFYLTESNNFESKVVIQFTPQIKESWSLYSRFEGLYNQDMNTNKHDRGVLYGRLGLNYKSVAFGLATNLDWYGPNKFSRENFGVFVRYSFK